MTRFRMIALTLIAVALLLLSVDLHLAYTTDKAESQQSIARSTGTPGSVANTLTVYLSGDRSLAVFRRAAAEQPDCRGFRAGHAAALAGAGGRQCGSRSGSPACRRFAGIDEPRQVGREGG